MSVAFFFVNLAGFFFKCGLKLLRKSGNPGPSPSRLTFQLIIKPAVRLNK